MVPDTIPPLTPVPPHVVVGQGGEGLFEGARAPALPAFSIGVESAALEETPTKVNRRRERAQMVGKV
jgi:hypothetical protein